MKSKHIIRIVLGTALILLVPLIAMQFTDEVDWNLSDFVISGILLIGMGLIYELIASRVNPKHRAIATIICVIVVLLIWAELAVGLFGTPFAGS